MTSLKSHVYFFVSLCLSDLVFNEGIVVDTLALVSIMVTAIAINSGSGDLIEVKKGDGKSAVLTIRNMLSRTQQNWHHFIGNPVLKPEAPYELWMGGGNLYAPAILKRDDRFWMWYGAQNPEGHDQIHLAFSHDGIDWDRYEDNPVIPVGEANHVNDPTVVEVGGTFYMYYSHAPTGEMDRIHLATSDDGMRWQPRGRVISPGPINTWDSLKVGRPSVIYEDGTFKLWYDGTEADPEHPNRIRPGTGRHVGFARSWDGYSFQKESQPVYHNAGAVDVAHIGDQYIMLHESREGTHWAAGRTETSFEHKGLLLPRSGEAYDRYGQVTPMLLVEDGCWTAIYYGAAEGLPEQGAADWNRNRIGVAFPQKSVGVRLLSGEQVSMQSRALDRTTVQVEFPETPTPSPLHLRILDGKTAIFDAVLNDVRGGDIYECKIRKR